MRKPSTIRIDLYTIEYFKCLNKTFETDGKHKGIAKHLIRPHYFTS